MNTSFNGPETGMKRVGRVCRRLIVAVPLTLALAGAITTTASVLDATPAEAWGIRDIGKGIKKAASKVKKKAKYVAKHGSNIAGGLAKDWGKGAKYVGKHGGNIAGGLAKDWAKGGKCVLNPYSCLVNYPEPSLIKPNPPAGGPGNWGDGVQKPGPSARGAGGRRASRDLQIGLVRDKSMKTVPMNRRARPTTGNDKSVFGRPVNGNRKQDRKVQGIRLGDVQQDGRRVERDKRLRRDRKFRKNERFTRDRKLRRDSKRLARDRKFKRNKRFTRDRRFKRRDRRRMSRQFRNIRKSRGFRMKRTRNRGGMRRNNRRRR